MDKKKIIGIVLFIFLGLIVYTFANPSNNNEETNGTTTTTTSTITTNTTTTSKKVTTVTTTTKKVAVVKTDSSPTISVTPTRIVILKGTSYDLLSGLVYSDDNDSLTPVSNILDTSTLAVGQYNITYTVTDTAGHTASATRTIVVLDPTKDEDNDGFTNQEEVTSATDPEDNTSHGSTLAPTINLAGTNPLKVELGSSYIEPGYSIILDSHDTTTPISALVVSGTVNTNIVGDYTLTYSITDRYNKQAITTRTVSVQDTTPANVKVTYISNEGKAIKYNNLNERIAIRFDTNEALDTNLTVVTIAGNVATLEQTLTITGGYEYVYKIIVNSSTTEGQALFTIDAYDMYGNESPVISFNEMKYSGYNSKIIVDTTAPVMELYGSSSITLEAGVDTYTELGAKVTDTVDGTWDITPSYINYSVNDVYVGQVTSVNTSVPGTYKVVYEATDASGKTAVDKNRTDHAYIIRTVTVSDTTAPVMELYGSSSITLEAGVDTYTELGAKVTDIVDGTWDITPSYINYSVNNVYVGQVTSVNTSVPGTYKVVYETTDNAGNTAVDKNRTDHTYIIRTVTVSDTTDPIIEAYQTVGSTRTQLTSGALVDVRNKITLHVSDRYLSKLILNGNIVINYTSTSAWNDIQSWFLQNNNLETFTFVAEDSSGNQSDPFVLLADKTDPTGIITYSNDNGNTVTNQDVTVTLTTNEPILTPSGWMKTSDTVFTKIYSQNGKDSVIIEDLYGNQSTINYEVKRIDKTAPIILGLINNTRYNTGVTYGISKTGSLSGVDFTIVEDSIKYIVIDGVSYTEANAPTTISLDGTHTIKVIDKAGNESSLYTFVIDKTAPLISLSLNYATYMVSSGVDTYYDNEPIIITVNATDSDPNLLYSFGDDSHYSTSNTYTVNWTRPSFNIYVKDSLGNTSIKNISLNIDSTPMSVVYSTYSNGVFTERNGGNYQTLDNVYIKPNNSWKLTYAKYLWSTQSSGLTKTDLLTNGSNFWHNDEITVPTADGTYYLWVYAEDYHGNSLLTVSNAFTIDNVAPVITIGTYNTNSTNQDITVTATTNEGTLNYTSHTFTSNGSFDFVATDAAGNTTTRTVTITNIDKTAPIITIGTYNTNPTNQDITVTATTNEGTLNYPSHTFTSNGSFDFVATDAAGNTTTRTVTITNIDKTSPTLEISYTNQDIIIFHSDYVEDSSEVSGLEPIKFTFTYNDSGSGLKVVKYASGNKNEGYFKNNGTVINSLNSLIIDQYSDTYTLYAEDNVGNTSIITKTVDNIYAGNKTATVGNLKITVGGLYWTGNPFDWVGYNRNISVTAINGATITGYGHDSSDSQYIMNYVVDNTSYGTSHEWRLKKNYNDYHTVYLKDSTGKTYIVWIEIN